VPLTSFDATSLQRQYCTCKNWPSVRQCINLQVPTCWWIFRKHASNSV